MKNYKILLTGALLSVLATGCVSDDDYQLAPYGEIVFSEKFQNFDEIQDGTTLNLEGWTNYAEQGTKLWREEIFSGNGYAEFSGYLSNEQVNIGWLITPAITSDGSFSSFNFEAAQHHLDSDQNKLEVYVSSDFDGTNVEAATWVQVDPALPTMENSWYEFVNSGEIDLSSFSGTIHIGFKVTGSGTDQTLDGSYQLDNIKVLK